MCVIDSHAVKHDEQVRAFSWADWHGSVDNIAFFDRAVKGNVTYVGGFHHDCCSDGGDETGKEKEKRIDVGIGLCSKLRCPKALVGGKE